MQKSISIDYDIEWHNKEYKILLNGKEYTGLIVIEVLPTHKVNTLEFSGDVIVNKLILDDIDTEYFVHHGFTENPQRGNASKTCVKYFFKAPIWSWFLDWKQNDNSAIRELSKTHQGFIPL